MEKRMKIYYIWDAYCPWCYGFNRVLDKFYKNHPDLDIEVISGGLLTGDRIKKIRESHSPRKAMAEITEIYGITFGEEYGKVLEVGEMVRNSHYPANGFAILRNRIDKSKWLDVSFDLHSKHFSDGRDLGDIEVYLEIGEKYGVDTGELKAELEKKLHIENPQFEDYLKKQELGVKIHPSVRLEKDGELYDVRNGAYTVEEMESNFSDLTKQAKGEKI